MACEFSGTVRDAFLDRGHDAWSCDLLPSESKRRKHLEIDARDVLADGWDLMIAHPPCTFLANSGNKHLYIGMKKVNGIDPKRWQQMLDAAEFFRCFLNAPIERIAVENPVMREPVQRVGRRPDQTIQPWQFGHGEIKRTCFWLKNLPPLLPTNIVEGRTPRVHHETPSPDRWKNRSRTLPGIAQAMAEQWGG